MPRTLMATAPLVKDGVQVDVSIALVSWNASQFLGPCLRSVYCNAQDNRLEVLVIDNASVDGSADLVEEEFPDVTVVRNDSNVGFARATNQAIRLSHGRYVLLLNPDTVLPPLAIQTMIDFLEQHPRVAAVGPRIVNSNGETVESYSSFPGLTLALRGISIIATASFDCRLESVDTKPKAVDWICGACMLVRREALDQVGLLDEEFFMYWEETDLCWRFWRSGWEVYYLPNVCMVHHVGGSSSQAGDKIYLNGLLLNEWINSAHRFLCKHYPLWSRVALASVAGLSIVIALIISPVVFVLIPSRRRQASSLLTMYLKAIVKQTRDVIRSLSGRKPRSLKAGQAPS